MKLNEIEFNVPDIGRKYISFIYPATEVSTACERLAEYHKHRWDFYDAQIKEIEPRFKNSVQVREQQVTGGIQLTPVMDQQIANQLNLAKSKKDDHWLKYLRFKAYTGAFGKTTETVRLSIDDVEYFHLHTSPEEFEEE
jgi:hypothetical protein